jgi:hypothetical protein
VIVLTFFLNALEFKDAASFNLSLAKVIFISIFLYLLWAHNFPNLGSHSGYLPLVLLIFLEYILETL